MLTLPVKVILKIHKESQAARFIENSLEEIVV